MQAIGMNTMNLFQLYRLIKDTSAIRNEFQ